MARGSSSVATLLGLLEQPEVIRAQDHLFLFIYLMRNYKTRGQALGWLITHWDYVKDLAGEKSLEDYPRYAATLLRTAKEAAEFRAFFELLKSDPVLRRALELAGIEIDCRMRLLADDQPGVAEVLVNKVRLTNK